MWQKTIGSVGHLLPNMVCKYCDLDGNEVPLGSTGELWLKGPSVMLGYLNNPNATKSSMSDDGYFKTGDIGHQDAQGNVFITDRIKELIKYKGFQVAPAELEGKLMGHPKIDDAAVVGVYVDELATEVPRAYVVLKPGLGRSDELADEIVRFIHDSVAQHKRLRGGVRFVPPLPNAWQVVDG